MKKTFLMYFLVLLFSTLAFSLVQAEEEWPEHLPYSQYFPPGETISSEDLPETNQEPVEVPLPPSEEYVPPSEYYPPGETILPEELPGNNQPSVEVPIPDISSVPSITGATPRTGCPTEGLVPCGTPGCPCTFCDFFVMFDRIVDFILFKTVPILAALMIAIGGFMYIVAFASPTSGGPETLSKAKTLFKSVLIGLILVYAAWLIVNTFFWVIGVNTWTGLKEGWWSIECESSVPGGTGPSPEASSDHGGPSGSGRWDITNLGSEYPIAVFEKGLSKPIKTITRPVPQPSE